MERILDAIARLLGAAEPERLPVRVQPRERHWWEKR